MIKKKKKKEKLITLFHLSKIFLPFLQEHFLGHVYSLVADLKRVIKTLCKEWENIMTFK